MFKFELGWLLREGFAEMAQEICSRDYQVTDSMQKWQTRIRRLRQHLRGWSKNVSGAYKKEKKKLLDKLDSLDKKAEQIFLSPQETDLMNCLNNHLHIFCERKK
jgi:DNA anti-recombination protein RmuC